MARKDQKKSALIVLLVFVVIIGLVILIGFIASKKHDDSIVTEDESFMTEDEFGEIPLTTDGLRTEALISKKEAETGLNESVKKMVDQGLMDLDQVLLLNKRFKDGDKYLSKGDLKKALIAYRSVDHAIKEKLKEQADIEEANLLAKELLEKSRGMAAYKVVASVPYKLALKASDQGYDAFNGKRYSDSIENYKKGLAQLEEVDAVYKKVKELILKKIKSSIDAIDVEGAEKGISQILKWDANNTEVDPLKVELEAIRVLSEKIDSAKALLASGKYKAAIASYELLIKDNPGLGALKESLKRAKEKFIEVEVKPLVDEAEKLFSDKHYKESLAKLIKANKLLPSDVSIKQSIAAVKKEMRSHSVEAKLESANVLYNKGDWKVARVLYSDVLKIDPANEEADQGMVVTSKRLAIQINYESALFQAEKYFKAKRYPLARNAMNEAISYKPSGQVLSGEMLAIQRGLDFQNRPVSVTVISDGKTWVSIVGSIAPKKTRKTQIEVMPDVYKVIGTRRGYKGVEFEYSVDANNLPIEITVKCLYKQ